ncbi:MAG: hypothetical protein KDK34_17595, partial [Leptospiraceae bacterium]|nr:hypothetical protein [Leptospiraceae bacterium]
MNGLELSTYMIENRKAEELILKWGLRQAESAASFAYNSVQAVMAETTRELERVTRAMDYTTAKNQDYAEGQIYLNSAQKTELADIAEAENTASILKEKLTTTLDEFLYWLGADSSYKATTTFAQFGPPVLPAEQQINVNIPGVAAPVIAYYDPTLAVFCLEYSCNDATNAPLAQMILDGGKVTYKGVTYTAEYSGNHDTGGYITLTAPEKNQINGVFDEQDASRQDYFSLQIQKVAAIRDLSELIREYDIRNQELQDQYNKMMIAKERYDDAAADSAVTAGDKQRLYDQWAAQRDIFARLSIQNYGKFPPNFTLNADGTYSLAKGAWNTVYAGGNTIPTADVPWELKTASAFGASIADINGGAAIQCGVDA